MHMVRQVSCECETQAVIDWDSLDNQNQTFFWQVSSYSQEVGFGQRLQKQRNEGIRKICKYFKLDIFTAVGQRAGIQGGWSQAKCIKLVSSSWWSIDPAGRFWEQLSQCGPLIKGKIGYLKK